MRRLRQGLTYANVMATVAVFVALGGTGVAAVHLSKNSVTSTAIKNGQVKNKDLGSNSVTSSKVKNGSLLTRDFKSGQLPQGPKGDQGAKGDQGQPGATGPSNGYSATTQTSVPWATSGTGTVLQTLNLPAGNYVFYAAVDAENDSASVQLAGCQISVNGGSSVDSVNVKPGVNNSDDGDAIALTGGATLASAGPATLDCSADSTSGSWQSSSLTAIKVASLN